MAIAGRVRWYLESHGVNYELLPHQYTRSSMETAREAHVPPERLAKCVLLEDERGYLMAILPASHRIELDEVESQLRRHMELASELELQMLFADCDVGAVPPLGDAYNLRTLVDDTLMRLDDVYFEAGDHEDLVHVSGASFRGLLSQAMHGRFSQPV